MADVLELEELGFALGVAVILDATLVRLLLVPAFRSPARRELVVPAFLDPILPRIRIH